MTQTFDKTTQHNSVGRATRRQDAPDKLTGRTRYAGDVSVAGMLHARLVLSPYAHARILSIDTSAAEAIPGVQAVYTSETLGMAIYMGAGPSVMYASHALEAFTQFEASAAKIA